jgi:hypothetical protein
MRLLLAFGAAAIVATIGAELLALLTESGVDAFTTLGFFPVVLYFSALFSVLFGLPAYLLGRRLKLISWWSTMIVGFSIGVAVALLLEWRSPGFADPLRQLLVTCGSYGSVGAISGIAFWLVWRGSR